MIINSICRSLIFSKLRKINSGTLIVAEEAGRWTFGNFSDDKDMALTIEVKDLRIYPMILFGGSVGVAESYMKGYWFTNNLTGVICLFLRNRNVMDPINSGMGKLKGPVNKLIHLINNNSRSGSRKNIKAHYDIGNDFFKVWLDKRMMYSSAVFDNLDISLDQASEKKLDKICSSLKLTSSDHLLEIGTGWGGLSIYAASNYGCRVTTTTISKKQYEYAKQWIHRENLSDKITLLQKDYRDLHGKFNKLVSIEMIEAIGHNYLETYLKKCNDLLKDDGEMFLQAITIADYQYENAKKSVDFIQKYIFPGGALFSLPKLLTSISEVTNFDLLNRDEIGPDYALTLKKWREKMFSKLSFIRSLGYSERFIKMWEFYFCYCEGGFIEKSIGNSQFLFSKRSK